MRLSLNELSILFDRYNPNIDGEILLVNIPDWDVWEDTEFRCNRATEVRGLVHFPREFINLNTDEFEDLDESTLDVFLIKLSTAAGNDFKVELVLNDFEIVYSDVTSYQDEDDWIEVNGVTLELKGRKYKR